MVRRPVQQPVSRTPLVLGGIGIVFFGCVLLVLALWQEAPESDIPAAEPLPSRSADAEVIAMTVDGIEYFPDTLLVDAGKPVRWEITGKNIVGCSQYLVSPQLGISRRLQRGSNVIEFTAPTKPGSYEFSCAMNMMKGTIRVV